MKRIIRGIGKSILWLTGGIIALLILILVLIRLPSVQDRIRIKTVQFLEEKIGTRVVIRELDFDFPKVLVLKGVYFEDQNQDTLLSGDTLKVDITLWKLLRNEVEVNLIDFRGITAYMRKTLPDSTFNFDYILKAFMRDEKKPTPSYDSTAAMRFSISEINLDRIRFMYMDDVTAQNIRVYLHHLDSRIKKFDLEQQTFSIPEIVISGVEATLHQSKGISQQSLTPDTFYIAPSYTYPDIKLGRLDLSHIKLQYTNTISLVDAKGDLGQLQIEFDDMALRDQRINVKDFHLDEFSTVLHLGDVAQKAVETTAVEVATIAKKGWNVTLRQAEIKNTAISYHNKSYIPQETGMDYNHLDVRSLYVKASALDYRPDSISGKIHLLSFTDSSGLDIRRLQTDFVYSEKQASLQNLLLETPLSRIQDNIVVTYDSLQQFSTDLGSVGIQAHIKNSSIGFQDLLVFVPSLKSNDLLKNYPKGVIHIHGSVRGQVQNLHMPELEISGLGRTSLKASGTIRGLPDIKRSTFDIQIANFSSGKSDLVALLPTGTIPNELQLPQQFNLNGVFKGSLEDFTTTFRLHSSMGSAFVDASIKNATRQGGEVYDVTLETADFNMGQFLSREETIGAISFSGSVSGTGFDPKTANMRFDGVVAQAFFNGYNYRNLKMTGTAQHGQIEAVAEMKDPNLAFDMDLKANMSGEYPQVHVILQIDTLLLQPLGFGEENVSYRGKLVADLETADPDFLNGSIYLTESVFAIAGEAYRLDTVNIQSTATADQDSLRITSEFLTAHIHGQYDLSKVTHALVDQVNTYYTLTPVREPVTLYDPQRFEFTARVNQSPLVVQLMPELKDMSDIHLTGRFDSNTGEIRMEGGVALLQYQNFTINDLEFDLGTAADALNYSLTFDRLRNEQIELLATSLSGKAQNDILEFSFQAKDIRDREHYRIDGNLKVQSGITELRLAPEGVLLDSESWTVSPDNMLRFGRDGIMAHHMEISRNQQQLSITSIPQEFNAPLSIQFRDFHLETLTRLIIRDSLMIGGVMDGEARLIQLQPSPIFTSELQIENFTFRGDTVGHVSLSVNNRQPDTYAASIAVTHKGNNVNIDGNYRIRNDEGELDFDVDIANLNLSSVEGFTFGQLDQTSGSIAGNLKINGTLSSPVIRGDIRFTNAVFRITQFNSLFSLNNQVVHFTSDGIELRRFKMVDRTGNEAIADGIIYTRDFKQYRFALTVRADNFQVLNSTRDNNKLYFGQLFVDTRMQISGSLENPVVDGTIRVKDNTSLTVIVPQEDRGIVEREGVVEFINMNDPDFQQVLHAARDSLSESNIIGMDVSVTIIINREAELNLIIDEANGDYLRVKGGGELHGGIDQSGKVTLTGHYELEEGVYSLTFNFLKREFTIQKGSSITWTGEPMAANVDVTAIYIAETAPLDLVYQQLGDADPNIVNTYKQKLPFEIHLTMKGELLKPEITFDIELPKRNYGVSGDVLSTVDVRLAQLRTEPAELNKQVFAVLLLNRFISDNPFQNAAGGATVSSLARQSASKLLSEQLNNLVGGMIAGFDLNLDLNTTEDYTSGELKNRTQLNVGVSKQLLSDQLKVTVGSNFELEGAQETNRKTTNIAGNVSAEYQLTKDGRYILRAYRKDEYIVVLGQVVETGIGFVITADYDRFKDIFAKKTEELKEFRKEERETRREERNALKEEEVEIDR